MLNDKLLNRTSSTKGFFKTSKSGQSPIELVPVMWVFFFVIMASMTLFEIMRDATIIQEVSRNLAFSKIANSGTLTTVEGDETYKFGDFAGNDNIAVNQQCFIVTPRANSYKHKGKGILTLKSGLLNFDVPIYSKAVVYRRPGNNCEN